MSGKQCAICVVTTWVISFGLFATLPSSASSQYSLTALVSFNGSNGDGPFSSLLLASDGNFYGTTIVGGSTGYGTVFKISAEGSLQTLYNFCSKLNCADGSSPWAGLTQGADGNFYGTTVYGGFNPSCQYAGGCGTIYRITPQGALTTLFSFDGESYGFPYTTLLQAKDGNFYGTSSYTDKNDGAIFKVTPAGKLTILHQFICCSNGSDPNSIFVQDAAGILYGTTAGGGMQNSGIVFSITTTGTFTVLHRFCQLSNCSDGSKPNGVIIGADGNLYGTTYSGGSSSFNGTIFTISSGTQFKVLYKFGTNASNPYGDLVQGTDGNFYGTTYVGGPARDGTVFSITAAGALTTLQYFNNTNGGLPQAALTEGTDRNFYGTTSAGGTSNDGVVFKLSKN